MYLFRIINGYNRLKKVKKPEGKGNVNPSVILNKRKTKFYNKYQIFLQ